MFGTICLIYHKLTGGDFNTEKVYGKKFKALNKFFNETNISVVASELIIPYILLCGYTKINGVEIVDKIYKAKEYHPLQYVRWSKKSNAETIDYKLSFLKNKNISEQAISAKSNTSNNSTIISFIRKYVKTNPSYTGNNCSKMWQRIIKALKYCNDKKTTNAFACWAIGAACMNLTHFVNLYKTFTELKTNKLSTTSKQVIQVMKVKINNNKALNDNDLIHYPYTMTDIFEKIAVFMINNEKNNSCLKEIYKLNYKKIKYTQIELHTNKNSIFSVVVKPPKMDKNKHLKLVNVCGNKSSIKKLTQTDKVNLLTIGGGRGQFIGFKLI